MENFLFHAFLYASKEMINKMGWDIWSLEGPAYTLLGAGVQLYNSQACLPGACMGETVCTMMLVALGGAVSKQDLDLVAGLLLRSGLSCRRIQLHPKNLGNPQYRDEERYRAPNK